MPFQLKPRVRPTRPWGKKRVLESPVWVPTLGVLAVVVFCELPIPRSVELRQRIAEGIFLVVFSMGLHILIDIRSRKRKKATFLKALKTSLAESLFFKVTRVPLWVGALAGFVGGCLVLAEYRFADLEVAGRAFAKVYGLADSIWYTVAIWATFLALEAAIGVALGLGWNLGVTKYYLPHKRTSS